MNLLNACLFVFPIYDESQSAQLILYTIFDLSIFGTEFLIGKYRDITLDEGGLCIGCMCMCELSDLAMLMIRFPKTSVGLPKNGMSMKI